MQKEEQPNTQLISCPACDGSGRNDHGGDCPNCGGMGLGVFFLGKFYYWGYNLSLAAITFNKIKMAVNLVINTAAYLFALAGMAALGWWIWLVSGSNGLNYFYFWRIKNPLLLIFWIGFLAGMFIVYRLSEEEASRKKIVKVKYDKRRNEENLPDSWQELKKTKLKIDISASFSSEALKAAEQAFTTASEMNTEMSAAILFFAAFTSKDARAVFSRLNADSAALFGKIKKLISADIQAAKKNSGLSALAREIFIGAYLSAYNFGQKIVEPVNLILSGIGKDERIKEILIDFDLDREKISNCWAWFKINDRLVENYKRYKKTARFKPASAMNRAYTAVATPVLNHFAYDLTAAAKWGRLEFCVARDKEIEEIFTQLEGGAAGIILVGPVGVGKNIIISGIAELMVEEDVPDILKDKRLIELDAARLISGASAAEAQERMLLIADEAAHAGNIVLYINNIENITGIQAGAGESLDLAEVLAGAMERKDIYCLAAATDQNYVKYIEGKPLGNLMTKVEIKEPAGSQAVQIIESKIGFMEGKYGVYFSYDAIAKAAELSAKYIHDKYLPAKAIEILEDIAAKTSRNKKSERLITAEALAEHISGLTGIPMTKVTASESEGLLNLEDKIHERMIGQVEAVNMVAASLRRARAELREGKRPIANFLFLGPTGVGKTELAKTIAAVYFGNENTMVRLDMSEYQQPDSVEKMIGSADGAVLGYLTEAVRKKPFSLVLLDEFEKAHPNILNLFLQVMDDGRLTDGQGRTIDFTSSIIIATSNAGAVFIQERVRAGADLDKIKDALINEHLTKVMRPELINRFDGVIVFKPLTKENVVDIARLMLNKVGKMLAEKGIGLRAEEEGIRIIAMEGFDPQFGARPLRRVLQDKIENDIANKILAGEIERRDTVVIGAKGDVGVEKGREL